MKKHAAVVADHFYLRPLTLEDIDDGWLDWMNDTNTTKFLTNTESINRASLVKYLESAQPPNTYMFAICQTQDNRYIGNAKIGSINWVHRHATYGRLIGDHSATGKGIGTGVIQALAGYAFFQLKLHRIYTSVANDNIASIRSNKRAGASIEGELKEHFFCGGRYLDCTSFSFLSTDFEKANWERHFQIE
jgi:[ribosomal protein S5]-alanine N-acetyltransferase